MPEDFGSRPILTLRGKNRCTSLKLITGRWSVWSNSVQWLLHSNQMNYWTFVGNDILWIATDTFNLIRFNSIQALENYSEMLIWLDSIWCDSNTPARDEPIVLVWLKCVRKTQSNQHNAACNKNWVNWADLIDNDYSNNFTSWIQKGSFVASGCSASFGSNNGGWAFARAVRDSFSKELARYNRTFKKAKASAVAEDNSPQKEGDENDDSLNRPAESIQRIKSFNSTDNSHNCALLPLSIATIKPSLLPPLPIPLTFSSLDAFDTTYNSNIKC